MKLRSLGTIFLVLATLLFTGCTSAPIHNVSDAAYTSTEQGVTQQDIAHAIETAGRSLGWIMKEKEPGHILATLHLRTHTAVVDIYYDRSKYSITYKDSTGPGLRRDQHPQELQWLDTESLQCH